MLDEGALSSARDISPSMQALEKSVLLDHDDNRNSFVVRGRNNNSTAFIDEGIRLLGTTFAMMEPVSRWIMEDFLSKHSEMSLTEEETKMAVFGLSLPVLENLYYPYGGTMIGKRDEQTGELQGCIVLREYDTKAQETWWNRNIVATLMPFLVFAMTFLKFGIPSAFMEKQNGKKVDHLNKTGKHLDKQFKEWHHMYAPKHHWYIGQVGTSPKFQGKGVGRKLMTKINDAADDLQMSCYLETKGDRNVRFYESLGYKVVATRTLEDPYEPSHKPLADLKFMVRAPKK